MRPALCCVTRRTLTSVFDLLRSINFCRLRIRLKSPACDALKILYRSRRTTSSTAPVVPLVQARAVAAETPHSRLEVLPAGHVPQLGNPERVAALIEDFVKAT